MDEVSAFVIPPSVTLRVEGGRLSIENEGDIDLSRDPGLPLGRVVSRKGSVIIGDVDSIQTVQAATFVRVQGNAGIANIRGERVELTGILRTRDIDAGAGGLRIEGETSGVNLRSKGDAVFLKACRAETIHVEGNLEVAELRADLLRVDGDFKATGKVSVPTVAVGGSAEATGGFTGSSLRVEGDILLRATAHIDTVHSGGTIKVDSEIVATLLSAQVIRLDGTTSVVRGIQASESVHLGEGRIQADAVVSPLVELARNATGRITLVVSEAELGPSSVKGCLSRTDFNEMIGGADSFLSERGLRPLGQAALEEGYDGEEDEDEVSEIFLVVDSDSLEGEQAGAVKDQISAELGRDQDDRVEDDRVEDDRVEDEDEDEGEDEDQDQDQDEDEVVDLDGHDSLDDFGSEDFGSEDPLPSEELPPRDLSPEELDLIDGPTEADTVEDGLEVSEDDELEAVVLGIEEPPAAALKAPSLSRDPVSKPALPRVRMPAVEQLFDAAVEELEEAEEELDHQVEQGSARITRPPPTEQDSAAVPIAVESVSEAFGDTRSASPQREPAVQPPPDPMQQRMTDILSRISSCYPASEQPPAVGRLVRLVDERDYSGVRTQLTDIWNELLKYHQRKGLRIQPQVTTTFNAINSLVRKLPA